MICNEVYLHVRDRLNYRLDKEVLDWGAIRPDIIPSLALKKHYQDESLDYVIDRIQSLIEFQSSSVENLNLNKYLSLNIGEIIHFLSDFVCLPHSQRWEFKVAMLKHIKYETKLNNIALVRTPTIPLYLPEAKGNDFINIKELILEILDGYKTKEDYINDLKYAVFLSGSIATLILKENKKTLLIAS